MPKQTVTLPRTEGMELDFVSHGRRGPGGSLPLSKEQVDQIKRTVARVPEVMVKVSGGARDTGGAAAHLKYIGRHGKLALETDEGEVLQGRDAASRLVTEWQLDLCRSQYRSKPAAGQRDLRAKLVHHFVLSMPARTPPEKVLAAARIFARENFALQHRYALVLHTDQAHPHVHLVVKAEHEFEPGRRLLIRKDTLRSWRGQFAALMREQGVAANATPRQVRGQVRKPWKDPIFRRLREVAAYQTLAGRGQAVPKTPTGSSFVRHKFSAVHKQLRSGALEIEPGKDRLISTRSEIETRWHSAAQMLQQQGEGPLAEQVERFIRQMPVAQTDNEAIVAKWAAHEQAARDVPLSEQSVAPRQKLP